MRLFHCINRKQNDWVETSIEELKKLNNNREPKYTKRIYYLGVSGNNEMFYFNTTAFDIFYDHVWDKFVYVTDGKNIDEDNCSESYEKLLASKNKNTETFLTYGNQRIKIS